MSKQCKDTMPQVIFDSRTAKRVYKDFNYYRSGPIRVPSGYIALVELTTHKDYLPHVLFTAVRTPVQSNQTEDCYDNCGIGKRYRRWKCCQSLGKIVEPADHRGSDYEKSIVIWGGDKRNDALVEFEYITRPGNYYLMADKCSNVALGDCNNPTIVEMTLIKTNVIHELNLPCCEVEEN